MLRPATALAIVLPALTTLLLVQSALCAERSSEMADLVLPWDDGSPGPTDVSGWNHVPAGKFGHLRAKPDGHIYAGQSRIRFFAVNVDAGVFCADHASSEAMAGRMAKFGVNLVRFHHLALRRYPHALVAADAVKSDQFDPQALDRMDYFIAQLKQRGIYVNLNLLTGRQFCSGDGLPKEIDGLPWKTRHAAAFFYPKMIELQKQYARKLLSRRNPYTKMTYTEDPAVGFVEIINEHGLMNSWFDGKLEALAPLFQQDLLSQWQTYLADRYRSDADLARAWADREASLQALRIPPRSERGTMNAARKRDWLAFLHARERAYYREMKRFLREQLGIKALLVGTIAQNSTPHIMAELDVIDVHEYWNHPRFVDGPSGRPGAWYIMDLSMVGAIPRKFSYLCRFRQAGKPMGLSEFNHCPPSPYASEGPLVFAAYAALQDWDVIYLFSWGLRKDGAFRGFFGSASSHPSIMANLPVAAGMIRRADVRPARVCFEGRLSLADELQMLTQWGGAWCLAAGNHHGPEVSVVHRVATRLVDQPSEAALPQPASQATEGVYVSDNGDLTLDLRREGRELLTVNSPRMKAVIGHADGRTLRLGDVTLRIGRTQLGWCTVSLMTLGEGADGGKNGPRRALLVATGKTENTGMRWEPFANENLRKSGQTGPNVRTIADWGRPPTRVEVIAAEVTVPGRLGEVTVHALDARGQRAGKLAVTSAGKEQVSWRIGAPWKTLWYEVAWR